MAIRLCIFLFIVITFLQGCEIHKFEDTCTPMYDWVRFPNHDFEIPLEVIPHKAYYSIGDTITFRTHFTDMVYDINAQDSFYMPDYPFDLGVKLWRFTDSITWENGWINNPISMDTSLIKATQGSAGQNDDLYVYLTYDPPIYSFEMKTIIKVKGTYIFQMEEFYSRYTEEFKEQSRAYNYEIEGTCARNKRKIVALKSGDGHYDLVEREMLHIDKACYRDDYTLAFTDKRDHPFGRGSLAFNFTGTFGFIVE